MPSTFTSFAALAGTGEIDQPAQTLDANFQLVNTVCQCALSGGPNAITLAAATNQPALTNPLQDKQRLGFVAAANSTGTVTITINGITYSTVGITLLSAGYYDIVFIQALFSGAGGFQNSTTNAQTQATNDASTLIATDAFVQNQIAASVGRTLASLGSYVSITTAQWGIGGAPAQGSTSTSAFAGTWRNMGISGVQNFATVCPPACATFFYLALRVA